MVRKVQSRKASNSSTKPDSRNSSERMHLPMLDKTLCQWVYSPRRFARLFIPIPPSEYELRSSYSEGGIGITCLRAIATSLAQQKTVSQAN